MCREHDLEEINKRMYSFGRTNGLWVDIGGVKPRGQGRVIEDKATSKHEAKSRLSSWQLDTLMIFQSYLFRPDFK